LFIRFTLLKFIKSRLSVPTNISGRIIVPIEKAPQNAKYSALRGILSAGSGGRTRTEPQLVRLAMTADIENVKTALIILSALENKK